MIALLPVFVGVPLGLGIWAAGTRYKNVDRWCEIALVPIAAVVAVLIALGNVSRWDAVWPALVAFLQFARVKAAK